MKQNNNTTGKKIFMFLDGQMSRGQKDYWTNVSIIIQLKKIWLAKCQIGQTLRLDECLDEKYQIAQMSDGTNVRWEKY